MAREIQRHPVRGTVTHVDFQVVDPDRPVSADVTVVLTGDPIELHHQDGVLEQQLFSISVRAKPSEIPQHFEVDISDIVVGTAVRDLRSHDPCGCRGRPRPRDGHRSRPAAAGRPRQRAKRAPWPRAKKALRQPKAEPPGAAEGSAPRSRKPCRTQAVARRHVEGRHGRTCSFSGSETREPSSSTPVTTWARTPSCCSRRGEASGSESSEGPMPVQRRSRIEGAGSSSRSL